MRYFVSLNRYERKKNIGLALKAFKVFIDENPRSGTKLIIAGGHDPTLLENREYL
jgi:alpha-1,3/alpha-1,6-mannosyltransferase